MNYFGDGRYLRVRTATHADMVAFGRVLDEWVDTPSGQRWIDQQIGEVESYLAADADP